MHGYGKIILFGEHAVVYGYPALAASINLGVKAFIKDHQEKFFTLKIPSLNLFLKSSQQDHILEKVFSKILEYFPEKNEKCIIELVPEIPLGAGLGSSAATSVALIRTLNEWFQTNWDTQKINEVAFAAETIFHGTPSGIDNTISSFGGFCYLRNAEKFDSPTMTIREIVLKKLTVSFLPNNHSQKVNILVVNTQKERKTKTMVAKVRERMENNPSKYQQVMEKIGHLSLQGYQAICDGDLFTLGKLMNQNQKYLRDLGVSCDEIDKICEYALQNGAQGAKLTGAGGGGCVIVLNPENYLEDMFRKKGFEVFNTQLGQSGKNC